LVIATTPVAPVPTSVPAAIIAIVAILAVTITIPTAITPTTPVTLVALPAVITDAAIVAIPIALFEGIAVIATEGLQSSVADERRTNAVVAAVAVVHLTRLIALVVGGGDIGVPSRVTVVVVTPMVAIGALSQDGKRENAEQQSPRPDA